MDIFPTSVEVSLSEEGLNYAPPVILRNDVSREEGARVKEFDVHIGSAQARFEGRCQNIGLCPDWHKGAAERRGSSSMKSS